MSILMRTLNIGDMRILPSGTLWVEPFEGALNATCGKGLTVTPVSVRCGTWRGTLLVRVNAFDKTADVTGLLFTLVKPVGF